MLTPIEANTYRFILLQSLLTDKDILPRLVS